MVNLGDKVKDVVSGASGIATAKSEWLTGCVPIGISVGFDKAKGEEIVFWTDEERCKVLTAGAYRKAQQNTAAAGPQAAPRLNKDPR